MIKYHIVALLLSGAMLMAADPGWAREASGAADAPENSQTFLDRDRLTEALMADELANLDATKQTLEKARTLLAAAEDELVDLNGQIADLSGDDPARARLEEKARALGARIEEQLRPSAHDAGILVHDAEITHEEELAIVSIQVKDMPEDTLIAFNRSLAKTLAQDLTVDLDSEEIQTALDGAYDKRQINALIKALAEETRFTNRARLFRQRAAETGDQRYLEKAEHMERRAEAQREMFLARIERYENIHEDQIEFEGIEDLTSDGLLAAEAPERGQAPH